MHPAPSLGEVYPGPHHQRLDSPSPTSPVRKDKLAPSTPNATDITAAPDTASGAPEASSTGFSVESSQSIFSVKDGAEVSNNRRASRRRTGPLSAPQREKAALIRKLGACTDCRRRRVACHPNHHHMSWEDAMRKYSRRRSSPRPDLAPLAGRATSQTSDPATLSLTQDAHQIDMDDSSPPPSGAHSAPLQSLPRDSRAIRTPLPNGPRVDAKPVTMPPLGAAISQSSVYLPNIDTIKSELETNASRMLSGSYRGRYTKVLVQLICWQDDDEPSVAATIHDLAEVFERYYCFSVEIVRIPPSSSDACRNSSRWLSRKIGDFTDKYDTRDVLKIVYYNGHGYLDQNRDWMLASPRDQARTSAIRWSSIHHTLEEACSDTLILLDTAYYPCLNMTRRKGILELLAASTSEDDYRLIGRNSFSRLLVEQLRLRALQQFITGAPAAELFLQMLSTYPKMIQNRHPSLDLRLKCPSPLHLQVSANSKLPSITLSPLSSRRSGSPNYGSESGSGHQLNFSVRLKNSDLDTDSWIEWLRLMPSGIKDVKVEGPYYCTFR